MSCINCGFILILISILMTKINTANGKWYERYRSDLQYGKHSSRLAQSYGLRHSHYYSTKYKHHGLSHILRKKSRRYTALDKVDDRLNNAAYRFFEKNLKFTTSNPSDSWEDFTTPNATLFANPYLNNFITYKDKTTTNQIDNKQKDEEGSHLWDKRTYSDFATGFNADSKGYLQDITTSKPSENHRQDTTYSDGLNTTLKRISTTESLRKALPWTASEHLPNDLEDEVDRTTISSLDPRDAVKKHLEHVDREGGCHKPRPKVIRVHEVHPDPSKLYLPPCTILHRCGPDTGCCENLKDVCKPKNITKVELYFFTTVMGQLRKVEKLNFENHTECECRSRIEDLMPRDSEDVQNTNINKFVTARDVGHFKSFNCTCPSLYSPRYLEDGTCICDCFDKQIDCLALKKGKEHFSNKDRLCIKQKVCIYPSCEFGPYIQSFGKCPKKSGKHHNKRRTYISKDRIT